MKAVLTTIAIALLLTSAACQSDGEKLDSEAASAQAATQAATTLGVTTQAEQPEVAEVAAAAPSEASFWSTVQGADRLVITGGADTAPVEVTDAEWLGKFQAAIGDGPGENTVPKCLPTYRITYFQGETELASFGAVCSAAEVAMFVRDGGSFAAEDADAVKAMLAEITAQ